MLLIIITHEKINYKILFPHNQNIFSVFFICKIFISIFRFNINLLFNQRNGDFNFT